MAGHRPGHPRLVAGMGEDVDVRDKRGHDEEEVIAVP